MKQKLHFMKVYVICHTLTHQLLTAFTNEETANRYSDDRAHTEMKPVELNEPPPKEFTTGNDRRG